MDYSIGTVKKFPLRTQFTILPFYADVKSIFWVLFVFNADIYIRCVDDENYLQKEGSRAKEPHV